MGSLGGGHLAFGARYLAFRTLGTHLLRAALTLRARASTFGT